MKLKSCMDAFAVCLELSGRPKPRPIRGQGGPAEWNRDTVIGTYIHMYY